MTDLSRHPHRPQIRSGTLVGLLLAVFGTLFAFPHDHGSLTAAPPETASVKTVTTAVAKELEANRSTTMLGTVNPSRSTTIGFSLPGRVQSLQAKRGTRVSSGNIIAALRTEVIQIEIAAARAQLRLVQQRLRELETGSRPEEIAEAMARRDSAAALSQKAVNQLKRLKTLTESGAASVDELDVAHAEANSLEQLHQAASIAYDRIKAGPRVEQVGQAKASVDLQTEQVRLLEDRLTKHKVTAPFDGYIVEEFIEAGAWVTSGDAAVSLIDLDTVEIEVAVPADNIANLQTNQSVSIQSRGNSPRILLGTIERIVPAADPRSRTFPVLIKAKNQISKDSPALMSGMTVNVELPLGTKAKGTFVPLDALVLDNQSLSVFVLTPQTTSDASKSVTGHVRRVPVTPGVSIGQWVMIRTSDHSAIKSGDLVVTRGNQTLLDGSQVEAIVKDD